MYPYEYHVELQQKEPGKVGQKGRVAIIKDPNNPNLAEITIQSPAEFKGPAGENGKSLYWSPEDFFVASSTQCIFTTFIAIAERSHLAFKDFRVKSKGILDKTDKTVWFTEIHHDVTCVITKESDRKKAEKVIEKTENNCLIANSMKTKTILHINIIVEED